MLGVQLFLLTVVVSNLNRVFGNELSGTSDAVDFITRKKSANTLGELLHDFFFSRNHSRYINSGFTS